MKKFIFLFVLIASICQPAFAGVLDAIKGLVTSSSIWAGIGVLVIGYILKRIPNDWIQTVVGKFAYGLGIAMTLGLSKYKFTKPFWAGLIEPYVIDLIDNTIGTFTKKFIDGLRSDD